MDPEACLRRIFDAFESKDWDEFDGAYTDLWQWISRGGFLPKSFREDPELCVAFDAGEEELRKLLARGQVKKLYDETQERLRHDAIREAQRTAFRDARLVEDLDPTDAGDDYEPDPGEL